MKKAGFYMIKDSFFEVMSDPFLKGNKQGNRPHYYCFEDDESGIYWIIPLSSRVSKYKKIIEKKEKTGKKCDILHIAKLDNDKESVFLIQDMFPITEDYIEREYTISGNHMVLSSEHTINDINKKAKKIKAMIKRVPAPQIRTYCTVLSNASGGACIIRNKINVPLSFLYSFSQ